VYQGYLGIFYYKDTVILKILFWPGVLLGVHSLALFFCACWISPGSSKLKSLNFAHLEKFKDPTSDQYKDKYGFPLNCEIC